jgi:F-type H+/Na+-transporting ATPase subunit alpha
LRLEMAQYRDLAAFAQFGSDLDKVTLAQLNRGRRLTEVLKQDQYKPLPVAKQVLIIFAGTSGYLDDVAVEDCVHFEDALYEFIDSSYPGALEKLAQKKALDDELRSELRKALDEFKAKFVSEHKAAAGTRQA